MYPQYPQYPQGPPYRQSVPNYLVWAILSTIFCCLPFGIVSIIYAAQVDSKVMAGDYAGALSASDSARKWAIAAAVSSLVIFGVMFIVYAILFFIGFTSYDGATLHTSLPTR